MIPFERLRSLVRYGEPDRELLLELADALIDLAADPGALVVGCRQLVHHHPEWGALWWLCSRALVEGESGARAAARELAADTTAERLAAGLPFPPDAPVPWLGATTLRSDVRRARPDLEISERLGNGAPTHVIVEPRAATGGVVLVGAGTSHDLDALPSTTLTWLVAPIGTVVPMALIDRIAAAAGVERLTTEAFDRVCGPSGLGPPSALARRDGGPVAPELLRAG